ncbi:MAG: DUF1622 domain-containing protein [Candidatus Methanoperedenaceae archaeon]|nr:DUF1622 domain-containing protein [Candidatus Methanoperedenaceae archaeon]MDW7727055.1 DUF1622 domain-containing protein [Candidatus Methanoperedens sp.]
MLGVVIEISSLVFGYFGAAIILYGGIVAAARTVIIEIRKGSESDYHDIRRVFTHRIIFGLDFLIAGDILKSIIAPTKDDIILLGAIVGIRTVLGYFLGKEISEFDEKK